MNANVMAEGSRIMCYLGNCQLQRRFIVVLIFLKFCIILLIIKYKLFKLLTQDYSLRLVLLFLIMVEEILSVTLVLLVLLKCCRLELLFSCCS